MTAPQIIDSLALDGFIFSLTRYAPGEDMAAHEHPYWSMALILSGEIEETVEGRVFKGARGQAMVKSLNLAHTNKVGRKGALIFSVRSDRPLSAAAGPSWSWKNLSGFSRNLSQYLGVLVEKPETLAGACPISIAETLEQQRDNSRQLHINGEMPVAALPHAKGQIGELARMKGLHPASFSRWFKRQTGLSPQEYRLLERALLAMELMAKPGSSLAEIAAEAGFFDESHMSRVLKTTFGVCPGVLREISLASS